MPIFTADISEFFEEISDTRTVLFTAEYTSIFQSIRCTNICDEKIRITLEGIRLLGTNVPRKVYLSYNVIVPPNSSTDLLFVKTDNSSEIAPIKILNGDSLVCYSDGYSNKFSCIISGYAVIEEVMN